ncbi:43330_t:CDS:2 [Gigaspora margarita]|uniref:43330_t:CDS:1 n=1 Tax=Gigaspora margarita TaxID=4874 RepID=A0ABN7V6X4_GIGMA|nr:43330_t:CDS:2 [Gigaspora margarita]
MKFNSEDEIEFNNEDDIKFDSESEVKIINDDEIKFNESETINVSKLNMIDQLKSVNEMLGHNYITKKDILNTAQGIARNLGFTVTIKSSGPHHFHLQCKHGGQPRNTSNLTEDTRQRKKMSKHCECPFLLKATQKKFEWQVAEITNNYNHSLAKNERIFYKHYQLTWEQRSMAMQMLKAGARSSLIYEVMRDEDRKPTATRKDISNIGLRINSLKENVSIEALITGMEEREYIVWQVVLIDATYKTNVYKLPFINFVGIGNLGINKLQTFGIAGAWISDESENSYIWIIKQLASLIFSDLYPLVFVMDNDTVLTDCNTLNLAIGDYKNLAALSSNEDKVIKYLGSKIMHFSAITTQCVEGAHSAIKHAIEALGKDLLQYENESISIDPLLAQEDKDQLGPLLEKVSQFALNKIKNELLCTTTYKACLYKLRVNYNLSYSNHIIQNIASSNPDYFFLLKSKLYTIELQYMSFSDEQQKSALLNKLDDILAVPEVKLSDIKVPERIIGKG